MDKYSKGIPTKPGLYWYREDGKEYLCRMFLYKTFEDAWFQHGYHFYTLTGNEAFNINMEKGEFCQAIAPEIDNG